MHTPLQIKNLPECMPHPWHPSVIYTPEGWNGHRWWMAQTPFPPFDVEPYRDRYELPCIFFSDDGRRWQPIEGNPIDDIDAADIEAHNYLSDPHLVLRGGVMECYYRRSILTGRQLVGNTTQLLRKTSTDGLHWSEREVVADLREKSDNAIWGQQIISPAIHWDGQRYRCWYVDRSGYLPNRQILMTTSIDGVAWKPYMVCQLDMPSDIDPWHIDVQYYDGGYQLLLYDGWHLHWLDSNDGIGFRYVSKVLSPTQYFMDFYAVGLYRACSVKVGEEIWVYFSAKNAQRSSIGLLRSKDRLKFCPVNGISRWQYIKHYLLPQASWHNTKRFVKHSLKPLKRMAKRLLKGGR